MTGAAGCGTLAICAIVRDEAPYLLEWIAFHILAGVERFRIYDNASTDGTTTILAALARHYPIELVPWPTVEGRSPQFTAYLDGYRALAGRYTFVAAIDVDEFLVSADAVSLTELLRTVPDTTSAIGINQFIFGSAGEMSHRPDLVISRFTLRKPDEDGEHHYVKTIARPGDVRDARAHMVELARGRYTHVDGSDLAETSGFRGRAERIVLGSLRLHHYMLKSEAEFAAKVRKGSAAAIRKVDRRARLGLAAFSARDERATIPAGDVLRDAQSAVRALVAEMADKLANAVARTDLTSWYAFLDPAPSEGSKPPAEPQPRSVRLYVHIGLHKTGTTALQAFLASHREELREDGLLVPRVGVPTGFDGHHLLPWSLIRPATLGLGPDEIDALWADLKAAIGSSGCAGAIVSSEEFSLLDEAGVARMARHLDGFDIVPIVLLRRPGDVLEGAYRTHVVGGGRQSIEEFAGDSPPRQDYAQLLRRWRSIAGDGGMRVGSYDDVETGRDVVRTVLSWLGQPMPPVADPRPARANEGLPAPLIELARGLRDAGTDPWRVDAWLKRMGRLPFSRAQLAEPRLMRLEWDAALDAAYVRQLTEIAEDTRLAPHLRSPLPHPEPRRFRTISGVAQALLELPSIVAGELEPEGAGRWVPRRLDRELVHDVPGQCFGHLDQPARSAGAMRLAAKGRVTFAGWAFHPTRESCEWFLLLRPLDPASAADQVSPLQRGIPRPDVAAAFAAHSSRLTSASGFLCSIDMGGLAAGDYRLALACAVPGGLVQAPGTVDLTLVNA